MVNPSQAAARLPVVYMTPGAATDTGATTPDSAEIDITGDIEVRAVINYTADTTQQSIVDHWPFGGPFKWLFMINSSGNLAFWNNDGGGTSFSVSTSTVTSVSGIDPGDKIGVRVTYDVSASLLTFYTSQDEGATWDQLGSTVGTGKTELDSIAAAVQVGNRAVTDQAEIYWVEVYDGIGGTLIVRFDAVDAKGLTQAFDSRFTGETWTPNGTIVLTSVT